MNNKAKVSAIPQGYASITPYLIVDNASQAIEFYKKAFNATEILRHAKPDNTIGHAELQFGDSKIMLSDEHEDMGMKSPKAYGGSPIGIHLYVENSDQIVNQAIKAGAKLLRPVEDMFYGDRCGSIEDPYGYQWYVSTHIEDVTEEEVKRRALEFQHNN